MQWIFMLIGLVLGWTLDESFSDAGIGALLGLGIGQAIRLSKLATQADQQARQLETTQKALIALGDRLRQLEVPTPPSNIVGEAPIPEPTPVAKAPDLVWELPAELAPVAIVAEPSQPLPADVWAPAPIPEPKEPAIPRGPNLIERAISGARNWLFGGNTVLRVGVVLLFLGLAFLLLLLGGDQGLLLLHIHHFLSQNDQLALFNPFPLKKSYEGRWEKKEIGRASCRERV